MKIVFITYTLSARKRALIFVLVVDIKLNLFTKLAWKGFELEAGSQPEGAKQLRSYSAEKAQT